MIKLLTFPYNSLGQLDMDELENAEIVLGQRFPEQIRKFYQEIGVGCILMPHVIPENYKFYNTNEILSPIVAARFAKGILNWDNQENYMAESTYELLEPGDLPFFEMYDSSHFLLMKLNSDNPNAVWFYDTKIEDSFEKFIWRLYYESPSYYGNLM